MCGSLCDKWLVYILVQYTNASNWYYKLKHGKCLRFLHRYFLSCKHPTLSVFCAGFLVSFWFVVSCVHEHIHKITIAHRQGFCCSHWEHKLRDRLLSQLTMKVASIHLGLVSAQMPLDFHIKCSPKLLLFWKAARVVVIVSLGHFKECEEQREGAYAQDKWNIWANAPSPLLSQNMCEQKGHIFESCSTSCIPRHDVTGWQT